MKLAKIEIDQLKRELFDARSRLRSVQKDIDDLKKAIIEGGGKLDLPWPNVVPRNKEIYKRWKDGQKFSEIAKDYRLSITTISGVCNRIERTLEVKGHHYKKYKSLLKYK
ncbi:MAG: hypothetical protein QM726_01055 [Chitinophagaceae bacterium]